MEVTVLYWGYIGTMEKNMEITIFEQGISWDYSPP